MIEIIVNTNSKNSVKKLSELEKIFKVEKIAYKVHRTSKTITAKELMDEVSSEELIVIGEMEQLMKSSTTIMMKRLSI